MTTPTAKGFTAVMAQRREPPDALDYFPTPPWATRALFRNVLPALGVDAIGRVWEPACGEGHMAADDFLHDVPLIEADWIITNPPFSIACEFTVRALDLAAEGVAMLVRMQWIEGAGRYEKLFRDRPPALYAPFVERVPMVKGRWDPDASTATAYAWFIWRKRTSGPARIIWIPPGCRAGLARPDDRRRFATWSLQPAVTPLLDRA